MRAVLGKRRSRELRAPLVRSPTPRAQDFSSGCYAGQATEGDIRTSLESRPCLCRYQVTSLETTKRHKIRYC